MLVSWDWLKEYVDLEVSHEEMADRLAMSGLNHEGTEIVADDPVLDLEVTSNRGDCLGHLGVAREVAVLLEKELKKPAAQPKTGAEKADTHITVKNEFRDACPSYTARVIRGVQIGPSPDWLVKRLNAIGVNSVNNVVDATNYVMMECGQPLHAFDLEQIGDATICIRAAKPKEQFTAIDHRTYELDEEMMVIADGSKAIAIAGVMGGEDSEVSESTQNVLIEAASFEPLSIRRTARKLKLHSPSSFRFERRPDQHGLDWASRRCCEIILMIAGGELCEGVVSDSTAPAQPESIQFDLALIQRVLGIQVPNATSVQILEQLGCQVSEASGETLNVTPPTWREDLTRPADLVEEIARIYGYEQIPEDAMVPIQVAAPRRKDIALNRVRQVLSACGVDEAMTPSVTSEQVESLGSFWTSSNALTIDTPILEGSTRLRRAIVPSLLAARRANETQSIKNAQLYEVATIYLPSSESELPNEQSTLGFVCGADLSSTRGIVEEILRQVLPKQIDIEYCDADNPLLRTGTGQAVSSGNVELGHFGIVSDEVQSALGLDQGTCCCELNVDGLTELLIEVKTADAVSSYPAVTRDLNFILPEEVRWSTLQTTCRSACEPTLLKSVSYQETYRNAEKDGAGKKRVLMSLEFQSLERTLTGQEVDNQVQSVVKECESELDAKLLG